MIILTHDQYAFLEAVAMRTRVKLEEWKGHSAKTMENIIKDALMESVTMGYLQAKHEVHSTPWEYVSQPIHADAARNDAVMNHMAAQGWDLHMVLSHWQFWRRHKGVGEMKGGEDAQGG